MATAEIEHSSMSVESLRFLQSRVSAFGLGVAALSGFFLLFRTGVALVLRSWADFNVTFSLHAAGVAIFLALGLYLRGRARSESVVRTLDAAGFLIGSFVFLGMEPRMPAEARPELILVLGLGISLMARAVSVPSTGTRTFSLALIVGLALLATTYVTYSRVPATATPIVLAAGVGKGTAAVSVWLHVALTAAWWIIFTATATTTSKVIYHLRSEVSGIKKLGQYELDKKLGEGGMGVVYRARHALLRRPTAIKLLQPDRTGVRSLARFEREVQLTARLSHPNTVTVFDYGRTPEGVFYYAMELLDGASLQKMVDVLGPMDPARVRKILIDVAGALGEAHGIGLIHRDIKPSNIMLAKRGGVSDVAKVLDFGLVKDLFARPDATLTNADVLTGTPYYMSPEAIQAPQTVDARSDIYALGAVGYFLLTGRPVFQGSNVVEVCSHHLHTKPVPPSTRLGRPLPEDLEAVIMACLEKSPSARPESAAELQARLEASVAAGAWSQDNADHFWRDNAAALAVACAPEAETSQNRTVAIDLVRKVAHA